jgi:hydrogenase-4 component B
MIPSLTIALFALPVFGAVSAFVFARTRFSTDIPYTLFTLGGIGALAVSLLSFFTPATGSTLPFITAFFLGLVGLGVALVSPYAIEYLARYRTTYSLPWLALAYGAFVIGMEAVISAPNVLLFLFAWELMSVSAYFLVVADGEHASLRAGLMYLIMTQIGFLAIASGLLLLASGDPLATWASVAANAENLSAWTRGAAFLLLFAGFGSKAGLVPLHQWLPYAHPQAPSHASALLSGVMLKVALFGFIEAVSLFPNIPLWAGVLLILVGLLSAFFGALHAVVEDDLKRLLAWSSIENMGLIFSALGIMFALATLPEFSLQPVLMSGALVFVFAHSLNHLLFKSSLFMTAGTIVSAVHTRDLDALGGLAKRWPVFAGVALALVCSAAALPPFGTFFGEWAYLQSLALGFAASLPIAASAVLVLGIVGLVSGLALFAFVKLFSTVFLGRSRSDAAQHAEALPPLLVASPMLGAILLLLSGPFAFPFLADRIGGFTTGDMLSPVTLVPSAAIHPLMIVALILGMGAISILLVRAYGGRLRMRATGTWDCGAPLTPRMEETATGFAASIRFFFRSFVIAQKTLIATPVVATNPWIASHRLSWSVASFWERTFYEPLVRVVAYGTSVMRRLQGGIVQIYLLLMLVALIIVLFIAL